MANQITKIMRTESILGGLSPSKYFGSTDQYHASIAIDPDMPVDDTVVGTSGFIRPTAMAKFSASEITGVPLWIVPSPKGTDTAVYANDGKVHIVSSAIAMGTALNAGAAMSSASGNGAAYYDNAWYFAKNTDVARYAALNGTPSLTQNYWSGTLAKTALTNTTYPSIRGVVMPNHVMHRHTDDKLYIADVTSGNQGCLHYVKTSKTTVEGDTNDGSTYNALDFDFGYYPTAIESFGTDLVVALIEGTSTAVRQSSAVLTFWDTTASTFQKLVQKEFPDPLITALKNVNGSLYVFSGSASGGCRVSKFLGGYSFQEVAYFDDEYPPLQGAVDHILNRVVFGNCTTYPETSAGVTAIGSKIAALGDGRHHILKSTSTGTTPWVTAVKYVQNGSFTKPQPIVGWTDGSGKGLDALSTTYGVAVFRDKFFRIGRPFRITKIRIPLAQDMAANMTITGKIILDDASVSATLLTINSTNFPNSDRYLEFTPLVHGKSNFFLELRWSGSALLTVALPIEYTVAYTDE